MILEGNHFIVVKLVQGKCMLLQWIHGLQFPKMHIKQSVWVYKVVGRGRTKSGFIYTIC